MDNVVAECKKRGVTGLDAFIDNVSISTVSLADHCNTLAILLTVLDDLEMSLRHDKCEFATSSIRFLGFRLDGQTTVLIAKVREVHENLTSIPYNALF